MVRAHLQKTAVIPARLANEDRLDRRLPVVVDAAPANPAIEPERLVMRVEHQLLSLAEVDAHKRHALVRQLLAHRRARYRKGAHYLLDGAVLLEISAPYLADLVHANHPHQPFPAD